MRAMCSTASPTLFQLPIHIRAAKPATPAANQKNVGVSRRSIATGLPRPMSRPAPTTPRSQRMITGTPPPVASMSTKPGARAVTLQAAHAGRAAAGEAGQPRSRRTAAPGRIRTPHVPIASFTAVSGPPFGRSEASAQTASAARTISANGIGRGAGSSACSGGATTARRPRARTSLSRTRRPFRTSGGGPHCGDTLVTAVAGLRRCRLALRGPLEVPPEQLDEARIRLRVAAFELGPGLRAHRRVRAQVGHCVSAQLERADAEKVEHAPKSLGPPVGEILHGQDEQLLTRKECEPALELLGVEAAREIGVVAVVIVLAALAGADAEARRPRLELDLRLGCQAVGLGLERVLEGQVFALGAAHHLVM